MKFWDKISLWFRKRPVKSALLALLLFYLGSLFFAATPFMRFAFHPLRLLAGEKSYLVLFQNNYELRPTGGFISAFGILTVKNGLPVVLNFEDVYGSVDDHPYVEPPPPLGTLLAHPSYRGHSFRDANFFPDFPASVKELEDFLHKTRPFQKIDGVFAVDLRFVEKWLGAVGAIEVEGAVFDSDHLLEQMEEVVADIDLHDLEALAKRKSGVKDLMKKLAKKSLLPWNMLKFLNAFRESFDEKHALAYFRDETLEEILRDKNWGGILESESAEDFLAVVDANYGGGKSNRYVKRSVYYFVDLESGRASLDVRYDHSGEYNIPLSTDYRGYVRAYVPANHSVKSADLEGREGNLFYAGKTFSVPIRANETVHFDFEFPPSTLDELTYRLNLWKQPGIFEDFYHAAIRLPTGMRIESDDFEVAENIATFRGFLNRDKKLTLTLEKDPYPPRVISQNLRRLNILEMEFNEPLGPSSLNSEEWKISDSDIQNPVSDRIVIDSVDLKGTKLIIKTRGMSEQPEERYMLEISSVSDFHGNSTGKRTYTFFQRLE